MCRHRNNEAMPNADANSPCRRSRRSQPPSGRASMSRADQPASRRRSPARSPARSSTLLGARNVVAKDAAARTIVEISPEQLLAGQPDVILAIDRRFHAAIRTDPIWRRLKAVQDGHIHLVPALPFSWARRSAGAQSVDRPTVAGQAALSRLLPERHPR